ncbi:MAG: hypothetical protein WEA77_03585 [Hyphomonas sp.]|uniref:hypothetical protein n=1 Tax=Hyphomonas sp. TaxID=87 RepID=UPI0034A00965
MTKTRFALAAAASTLVLAGCQYWPWKGDTTSTAAPIEAEKPVAVTAEETVTPEAAPVEGTETCDVLESRGWEAWVNRMPGPGAVPTIHVIGKVDVRTGGYTFDWKKGPTDRSAMPALRLKLIPKAPGGAATTAITTEDVKYEAPASSLKYSRVIISCGATTLGEIAGIMDVQ